jgi:hypothetical protein
MLLERFLHLCLAPMLDRILRLQHGYIDGEKDVASDLTSRYGCSYQKQFDNWVAELRRSPLKVMQLGSLEAILGCVRGRHRSHLHAESGNEPPWLWEGVGDS